tara:strand:+ start:29100 stop:29969 length:870 start_codon:yes stop_codon:yes gene_type:complete
MNENMRNEETMMKLIFSTAENDDRIRAVVMNGSRASSNTSKDMFQDYDIVYVVTDVVPFVNNKQWHNKFGDILISQTPDEMTGDWFKDKGKFTFLMLFEDENRIDLSLIQTSRFLTMQQDSQSVVLLDKDHMLNDMPPSSDKDYLPKPPTEKAFLDCCNEFLWVSTYVAKGLYRQQLTYAKFMSEHIVKQELIKLLTWYAGLRTNFAVSLGQCGKNLAEHVDAQIWDKFSATYVGAQTERMWDALFTMCELFNTLAKHISQHYQFSYDSSEYARVVSYLKSVRVLIKIT